VSQRRNSLAILGGAFNPIHFGHLSIAKAAREQLGYSRILFIPSCIPAHKRADLQTSPADRVALIRLAIEKIPYIGLEICEIARGGVSYTIDTLEYVEEHYEFEGKPGLIIGDDLVDGFHTWKMADEISRQTDLIVARRNTAARKSFSYDHIYLDNQIIDSASSDIRRMVRNGEDVTGYLPEKVIQYIEEHGLYR
jgi:nicotinate-nucleotide adenylyltransferase